jgi:hypothetical protein
MKEMEQSPIIFPYDAGERPLWSTGPAAQAKIFRRTIQGYTIYMHLRRTLIYLYSLLYSVEADAALNSGRDGAT